MNPNIRSAMVGVVSAAIVIAAWNVRPGSDEPAPDGTAVEVAVVTTDTSASAVDEPSTPTTSDQSIADADDAAELAERRDDVFGDEPTDVDDDDSTPVATAVLPGEPLEAAATPVAGFLSAAPLDIDPSTSGESTIVHAAARTDCQIYFDEEWRRDEAGLIDWDALYAEEEFSEEELELLPLDLPAVGETGVLAPRERPVLVDMGGPVDVTELPVERLLWVTERCWEAGLYPEGFEEFDDEDEFEADEDE